ncbi:MAG: hypothetical protein QXS18_04935 [Thermoplasmata archaeon]
MTEPCQFAEDIGFIKAKLESIEASLNGKIKDMKNHIEESHQYRKKIDELWAGVHFAKWIIMLIFGTGLLFNIIKFIK